MPNSQSHYFLQDDKSGDTVTPSTPKTVCIEIVDQEEVQEDQEGDQVREQEDEDGGESIEDRSRGGNDRPNSLEMFDLLTRLQSSRLDDQRCSMPSSPPSQQPQLQQQQLPPHQQNTILRSEAKTR